MICNNCGETMSGDGIKTALHCPSLDASDREPDADPLHCDALADDHPLWLVNAQILGLLDGVGASEDHENVSAFLRGTGLPASTVERMRQALCRSQSSSAVLNDDLVRVSEDGEGQENECPSCGAEPGQMCSGPDPDDPDGPLGVEYGRLVHRARQQPECSSCGAERSMRIVAMCANCGGTLDKQPIELTDDMLRYAMAAMSTGSPADAEKFRRFWRFAMEAWRTA